VTIFLIEYDRESGKIIDQRRFSDNERPAAEDLRLMWELRLRGKGMPHEVVLLEAPSEEDLRHTHRRYFEDLAEIGRVASS
jgi:hypothetical protein